MLMLIGKTAFFKKPEVNLNTSYVNVNLKDIYSSFLCFSHLNTSYVNVNPM